MLERLIDLSLDQLGAQVQSFGSLDGKAGTVLGADAVFAGLLFRQGTAVGPWAAVAMAALALSVVTGVTSMWVGRPLLGPLADVFYREYAGRAGAQAQAQLLSDVADAVTTNERQLAIKAIWWVTSATTLMMAVLLALAAQI